jgi:hypothetical protein
VKGRSQSRGRGSRKLRQLFRPEPVSGLGRLSARGRGDEGRRVSGGCRPSGTVRDSHCGGVARCGSRAVRMAGAAAWTTAERDGRTHRRAAGYRPWLRGHPFWPGWWVIRPPWKRPLRLSVRCCGATPYRLPVTVAAPGGCWRQPTGSRWGCCLGLARGFRTGWPGCSSSGWWPSRRRVACVRRRRLRRPVNLLRRAGVPCGRY